MSDELSQRTSERMAALDMPVGTDDPALLALGASSIDGYDPRHPHERWDGPTIPRTLDDEGRCLVCGLLVNLEAAEARAERAESALKAATAHAEELADQLDAAFAEKRATESALTQAQAALTELLGPRGMCECGHYRGEHGSGCPVGRLIRAALASVPDTTEEDA